MHRLLFFALWLALIAVWLCGCRKPAGVGLGLEIDESQELDVLTDGIVTCELRKDISGHVYEKNGIPLRRCFAIWMKDNAEQDHYEEWFHKQYGAELSQEGRKLAQKHCLGRI